MVQVRRLGHATLTTPDLERAVRYYTDILGLSVFDKSGKRAVLGTTTGFEAIELEQGDAMSLTRLSFQVAPGTDLKDVARDLEKHGVKVEQRSGITPGIAKASAAPGTVEFQVFWAGTATRCPSRGDKFRT